MVLGLAAEPLHRWLGHVTHRPRLSERGGLEMLTSRIQARNLTESNGARLAGAVSCVRDNVVSSRPDLRCPPAIPAIGGGGMGDRSAYKSPPPARRARLYDARLHERDACGIGFVADLHGRPSRAMVERALCGLERLRHRGAVAADARTGDGAGLLLPIDQEFYAAPGGGNGRLGLAMAFLPADRDQAKAAMVAIERALAAEGLELERWRTVPVDPEALGDQARASMPAIEQAVFRAPGVDDEEAERRCLRAGRRAVTDAHTAGAPLYLASCSTRTVTYKALCAADQLAAFYADLADERLRAPFTVFHQRYSTNTTPSWERAQPFRFLCHNGEINTLEGNRAWMRAREGSLGAAALAGPDGADPEELLRPVLDPGGSDSAMLDNAVELLGPGGRCATRSARTAWWCAPPRSAPSTWRGTAPYGAAASARARCSASHRTPGEHRRRIRAWGTGPTRETCEPRMLARRSQEPGCRRTRTSSGRWPPAVRGAGGWPPTCARPRPASRCRLRRRT